jgi:hypothetical protein
MTRATALCASIATNLLWRPTSSRRSRGRYVAAGAGSAASGGARNAPLSTMRKARADALEIKRTPAALRARRPDLQ